MERAHSAKEYLEYWKSAMADIHWFKKRRLFDYNRDEMIEDVTREFGSPGSIGLVARSQESGEVLGVLGVSIRGNAGVFGRWEPAVRLKWRSGGAGEALVREAFSWLRSKGVSRATCVLRVPHSLPGSGEWHKALYEGCGFERVGLAGIMLLADLRKANIPVQRVRDLRVVDGGFSLEDFADFTRRAYLSTPEDVAVHGKDPFVSILGENMRVLRAVKHGDYGSSAPECWKVAMLGEEVAGFIIGFLPKSEYRPSHGVIAELGVFPEFRRKGIAHSLVVEMLECFRKYGCRYSYVGTPRSNEPAIRLYQKAGHEPVFQIVSFEKRL